jgi:hypothetical protein
MNEAAEQVQEKAPQPSSVPDAVRQGIIKEFSGTKHKGEFVETKWMAAYQRVVDAYPEGKRKQVMEFVRPAAVAVAKINKVGAGIADYVLRFAGSLNVGLGLLCTTNPNTVVQLGRAVEVAMAGRGVETPELHSFFAVTPGEVRRAGMRVSLQGAAMTTGGRLSGAQFASGFMADIVGMGGEKIARIQNKILGKLTAPAAMPAAG